MKTRLTIFVLILSLGMWAQSTTPTPDKTNSSDKAACACCDQGKCCEGMACDRKDAKQAKDGKAGCCAGMKHDVASHDMAGCCGKDKDGKMACMRKDGEKAANCCSEGKCCGDKNEKVASSCCPGCCSHEKTAAGAAK